MTFDFDPKDAKPYCPHCADLRALLRDADGVQAEALDVLRFYANPNIYALRLTKLQLREFVEMDGEQRARFEQKYGLPVVIGDKGNRARKALGLDPNDEEVQERWLLEFHDELKAAAQLREQA